MLPVALDVEGRSILIVGGGGVAARKSTAFLEGGAYVTVISPRLQEGFPAVDHLAVEYRKSELSGFSLVCACTDSRAVNAQVASDANEAGIWCNIADDPDNSDFHTAAVVRRGEIAVGITSGGVSPVLSAHLKRKVEEAIGREYGELLEIANSYRIDTKKRGDFWRQLLESEILLLLKTGKRAEAEALFESLLP
ncbi:bifunctional precorrin-2 dehydrogenase/sirohydrochlorin ferrochelatase [bacterium]|nr:MAG: bifunctional precorrin-2 dehydrogenase/sirohydrochlorin ferrochelatase [bacterium]